MALLETYRKIAWYFIPADWKEKIVEYDVLKRKAQQCKNKLEKTIQETENIRRKYELLKENYKKLEEQCNVKYGLANNIPYVILEKEKHHYTERLFCVDRILANIPNIVDVDTADAGYHLLTKEGWENFLTEVYKFKKNIPWRRNIFDCDNHALLMQALVSWSAYQSYLQKKVKGQVAFGIAWSRRHAYNFFIDVDNTVWVYEPQSNRIVGKMAELNKKYNDSYIYKTRQVWIMV